MRGERRGERRERELEEGEGETMRGEREGER